MDDEIENESVSEEAEHDPYFDWIGCPKCGLPINIVVPVKNSAYDSLAYVYDMLEHARAQEAREAIRDVLGWMGGEINDAQRRHPYYSILLVAGERAEAKTRRAHSKPPKPRHKGARKASARGS